jgi:hypothetical protein
MIGVEARWELESLGVIEGKRSPKNRLRENVIVAASNSFSSISFLSSLPQNP